MRLCLRREEGKHSFWEDLEKGMEAEEILVRFLRFAVRRPYRIWRMPPGPDQHLFDVLLETPGGQIRIEVKNDLKGIRTGNVAVEIECDGKPSGINVSIADYFAYLTGYKSSLGLYLIPRGRLISMVKNGWGFKRLGGDGNKARFVLFHRRTFLPECDLRLDEALKGSIVVVPCGKSAPSGFIGISSQPVLVPTRNEKERWSYNKSLRERSSCQAVPERLGRKFSPEVAEAVCGVR